MIQLCNKSNRDTDYRVGSGGTQYPTGPWRPLSIGDTIQYNGRSGPWTIQIRDHKTRSILDRAVIKDPKGTAVVRLVRGVVRIVVAARTAKAKGVARRAGNQAARQAKKRRPSATAAKVAASAELAP